MSPTKSSLIKVIDHTFLDNEEQGCSLVEQRAKVELLVEQAVTLGCFSVCVRESMVKHVRGMLNRRSSKVKLTSVVGFPDGGAFSTEQKVALLAQAKSDGADEFDMVMCYQNLDNKESTVRDDILAMSEAAGQHVLKVIFENSFLTSNQIKKSVNICLEAFQRSGADLGKRFLKTSTGYADSKVKGAQLEHVRLMHSECGGAVGIKPAGGIADFESAIKFFHAAGAPLKKDGVDPYKFRVGSSSLLLK